MSLYEVRSCPCGSGLPSSFNFDARGIILPRTCNACHAKKMATYRPEVLVNPNYDLMDEVLDND